jgi:hypothetical protein
MFIATGIGSSASTGAAIGATGSFVPTPAHMESVARPSGPNGVWLEFNGSRWYSDGRAVAYSSDRFVKIGDYREFPVYRESTGTSETIWVSVAQDGPLAPYAKR